MKKKFNDASLVIGETAVTREQVLALYRKAVETKYLPGLIDKGGKKVSEVLIRDVPKALTGVPELPAEKRARITEEVRSWLPPELKV